MGSEMCIRDRPKTPEGRMEEVDGRYLNVARQIRDTDAPSKANLSTTAVIFAAEKTFSVKPTSSILLLTRPVVTFHANRGYRRRCTQMLAELDVGCKGR